MNHTVTIQLPHKLASLAQTIASQTQRPLEEVLVEWLDRAASDLPVIPAVRPHIPTKLKQKVREHARNRCG